MYSKLSKKQLLTLIVLVCGSFVTFLNQTLITPALSTIMVEFSIGTSTVQWLVNGFTMVSAIMIPVTAYLIDNYSTRRLYTVAMSLFLAGSLLAAWGPLFSVLLGGRLLQAAGAGLVMPMVLTQLMISFPPDKRGRAMGVFGLINAVAPSIGPTLSGLVIDHTNWHVLFVIVSALTVVGLIAGLVVLEHKDGSATKKGALDKPSLACCSLGLALILYSFSSLGSMGFNPLLLVIVLAGCALMAYFFRRQGQLEEPLLKISVLHNRRFAIATILSVIVQAAMMCGPILVPIYIQTIRGFSATTSGLTLMPGALAMCICNPLAGRLFDKYGPRVLSICGGLFLTLGTACMCFISIDTPLWMLTLLMVIINSSVAFINTPISTWGMNALDDNTMSHGTSINNTARMVAGSLGTAIIISVSALASSLGAESGMDAANAQLIGFNVAFGVASSINFVGFILAVLLVKKRRAVHERTDESGQRRMTIESIMKRDVYVINEQATVADAAALFIEKDVSAVPVVTASGEAIGFISDGDILRELSNHGDAEYIDPISMLMRSSVSNADFHDRLGSLMEQPVTAIAHMGIISVDIHDRLSVVCRVLSENHLKKVPVLHDGKIVGVINRSDITKFAMSQYIANRETMITSV